MTEAARWPAMDVEDIDVVSFGFGGALRDGETVGAVAIQCTVIRGTDATPAAVLVGGPTVLGAAVLQRVQGRVWPVVYHLRVKATLVPSGRVVVVAADLPVERF